MKVYLVMATDEEERWIVDIYTSRINAVQRMNRCKEILGSCATYSVREWNIKK